MTRPIIVIAGGGHAKVLIAALQAADREIVGIVDADPQLTGQTVLDVPVLGDDATIGEYDVETIDLVNGIGSTGDASGRRRIFDHFSAKGYHFATAIHPSAIIAGDVSVDEGAQIMAGAIIQPGCSIGSNAVVNTGARIDHDCTIGAHAHIAPGAVLCGGVRVGEGAHVGAGATVLQNLTLGGGSLIAAGAVVIASVAEATKAAGVPAKRIGTP